MADSAALTVRLAADIANFQAGMNQAKGVLSDFNSHFGKIGDAITGFMNKIPLIGASLASGFAVKEMIEGAANAERTVAKLQAVLKSTGDAAGLTARQMQDFAKQTAGSTMFGKGETVRAETMLASMGGVSGDNFKGAIKAAQDMATVMGDDLESATRRVGRALQDPEEGLAGLAREGVHFSSVQKDLIKNFEDTGRHAQAQQIILNQLRQQFGGAAAADANTFAGRLHHLGEEAAGMGKQIGELLLPLAEIGVEFSRGILAIPQTMFKGVKDFFEMIEHGGMAGQQAFEQQQRAIEKVAEAHAKAAAAAREHEAAVAKLTATMQKNVDATVSMFGKEVGSGGSAITRIRDAIKETQAALKKLEDFQIERSGKAKGIVSGVNLEDLESTMNKLDELRTKSGGKDTPDILAAQKHLDELQNSMKGAEGINDLVNMGAALNQLRKDLRMAMAQEAGTEWFAHRQELESSASKIKESMMTPIEEYEKAMKNLRELSASGLISPQTFGRASQKDFESLVKANEAMHPPEKGVEALAEGTAAAYSKAFENSAAAKAQDDAYSAAREQIAGLAENTAAVQALTAGLAGFGGIGGAAAAISINEVGM